METNKKGLKDGRTFLKVKAKSLAVETRIIRKEEGVTKSSYIRLKLSSHRKEDVRPEARVTFLAYGLIRLKKYSCMEPKAFTEPSWTRIRTIAKKYGPLWNSSIETLIDFTVRQQEFHRYLEDWIEEAKKHYESTPKV